MKSLCYRDLWLLQQLVTCCRDKTTEFTQFKVNTNQSSLLLYWQNVIIQQSVNYGNKVSNTNGQIMLEISKQSSITNPRNRQAHTYEQSCMHPLNSWAVWVTETSTFPKTADFPVYVSWERCGSSTFLQIPAVPYKSWAEAYTPETVVSLPRSILL